MVATRCLVVVLTLVATAHGFGLEDTLAVLKLGREVIGDVFEAWGVFKETTSDTKQVEFPLLHMREKKVIKRLTQISQKVDHMGKELQLTVESTLGAILTQLPSLVRLELHLEELSRSVTKVDASYRQMTRYVKEGYDNETGEWRLENFTLENLAEQGVSHDPNSVRGLLDTIHIMLAPQGSGLIDRGLLIPLRNSMQESSSNMCNLHQSPQQLLFNLYTSVALTELKGYAMMQFSWMLLKLYKKGNFTVEAQMMRDQYQERTIQKIAAVKSAMRGASRELWRCDPKHHVEGETFVELTQLLQGHIQNEVEMMTEVDMNVESTCRENCGYYSYAKSHGCYQNQFCSKQPRCSGKLIDCRYYDSDMWVCQADKESDRRYDWIEYENGRVLGQKGSCTRGTTKVDSWWRWLFWHCSYCFCLCDEQGPKSDRYFNLRPVKADLDNNMVVTGLRFIKVNRVIHLQIQEGILMPHGGINMSSLNWRPADDYRISDSDVHNGDDYHTLSWEQRAIDLDDLVAPPGHVMTGLRFRRVGTHMNLEIMVTPINFTEGTLIQPKEKSMWIGNDNTDASLVAPRTRLQLKDPDVPTRSLTSRPDSKNDQFLLFTHSDIDADAAQNTVPYLDAQPVTPDPPTMLGGAGIYHKGQTGYGGFIAPKVITYDYSPHINAQFPSSITK